MLASHDSGGHGKRDSRTWDFVHTENSGATFESERRGDRSSSVALRRYLDAGYGSQKGLSGGAEDNRKAKCSDIANAVDEVEIVLERLAKTDPRVDCDVGMGKTGFLQ